MEALRLIKQLGLRPRRTIRCVLWTNEENGTRGANAYADSLGDAVRGHVAAVESDGGVETPAGFGFRAPRGKRFRRQDPRACPMKLSATRGF